MTSQDIDSLDEILDSLGVGVRQTAQPPYTEDNRPQGLLFVQGKKKAKAALLKWRDDEVRAELKHLYGFQGAFISDPIRKQIEDRINQLQKEADK